MSIELISGAENNTISCHNCGKGLINWRQLANADITITLILNCPFCNTFDTQHSIDGLFTYIGIPQDQSIYSTIITNIEEQSNNTWRFEIERHK